MHKFKTKVLAVLLTAATAATSVVPSSVYAVETPDIGNTAAEADGETAVEETDDIQVTEEADSTAGNGGEEASKDAPKETADSAGGKEEAEKSSPADEKPVAEKEGAKDKAPEDPEKGTPGSGDTAPGKQEEDGQDSLSGEAAPAKEESSPADTGEQAAPAKEDAEKEEPATEEQTETRRFRIRFDEGEGTVRVIFGSDEGADKDDPSVLITKKDGSKAEAKTRQGMASEAVVEDDNGQSVLMFDLRKGEKISVYTESAEGYKVSEYAVDKDAGGRTDCDPSYTELFADDDMTLFVGTEKIEEKKEAETGKVYVNLLSDGGSVTIKGNRKTYELSKNEKGAVSVKEDGKNVPAEKGKYAFSFEAEDGEEMTVTAVSENGVITAFSIGSEGGSSFEDSDFDAEEKPEEFTQTFTVSKDAAKVVSVSFADMPEFEGEQKVGDVTVEIFAEKGIFPAGTTFKAEEIDIFDLRNREISLEAERTAEGSTVFGVDITFYDKDGEEIQPNGMVQVMFHGLADGRNADELTVVHVDDTGKSESEVIEAEIKEDDIIIENDAFSPYILLSTSAGYNDVPNPGTGGTITNTGGPAASPVTFIDSEQIRYSVAGYHCDVLNWTWVPTVTDQNHPGETFRAFCADPFVSGIHDDHCPVTRTHVEKITTKNILKCLYYGMTGSTHNQAAQIAGSEAGGMVLVHYALSYYVRSAGICSNMDINKWNGAANRYNYEAFWQSGVQDKQRQDVAAYMDYVESAQEPLNATAYIIYPNTGDTSTSKDQPYLYVAEDIKPAKFHIKKLSGNTTITAGSSSYKIIGAEYWVYAQEAQARARRTGASRLAVLTTRSNGVTNSFIGDDKATYYIIEGKAPAGYLRSDEVMSVTLEAGKDKEKTNEETPKVIDLTIYKRQKGVPSWRDAIYPLEGAKFMLYNSWANVQEAQALFAQGNAGDSSKRVKFDGKTVFTTDAQGKISIGPLPIGKYWALEWAPPEGYERYTRIITIDGTTTSDDTAHTPVTVTVEDPPKGSISIVVEKKSGNETATNDCEEYSLEGAVFGVYNNAACREADLVTTVTTDKDGKAETADGALQKGKDYWVKEISPSKGFDVDPDPHKVAAGDFEVEATQVLLITEPPKFDPAQIKIVKRSANDSDEGDLSGAEFTFKYYKGFLSESEVDSTDPERSWTIRTKKTGNEYSARFRTCIEDGTFVSGDEFYIDPRTNQPSFPLGTVTIEETKAPENFLNDPDFGNGKKKLVGHIKLTSDNEVNFVVVSGADPVENTAGDKVITISDPKNPWIRTSARDAATQTHSASAGSGTFTFIDTVTYGDLKKNTAYTVSGTLMDKDTKKAFVGSNGKKVTASSKFNTGDSTDGSVEVTFTFECKAEDIEGHTLVVTEVLKADSTNPNYQSIPGTAHNDLNDEAQTIYITEEPRISTLLLNKEDNTHFVEANADVELEDTIVYEKLTVGTRYTVNGVLMDKSTGRPLQYNGKDVTSSVTFTPTKSSGSVTATFKFNTTGFANQSLVAYETLLAGGEVVAEHKDPDDEGQTVKVKEAPEPYGGTLAKDSETLDHVAEADEQVTILDDVTYHNMIPGEEYEITGTLMDKTSNSPLTAGGKTISVTEKFTPDKAEGTHTMTFTLNAVNLKGKDVVVFEVVKDSKGEVAFRHENINDEGQTIHFPGGDTELLSTETKTHTAPAAKDITLRDRVTCTNLDTSKKYTVKGILMDKDTGKPLLINGKEVTAEQEFSKPQGATVEQTQPILWSDFTFDASSLAGKSVVAFEEVYYNGKVIFSHKDINDEKQTVRFPGVGTSLRDSETGRKSVPANKDVKLVDTVSYSNVTIGEKYTVNGVLMDKATGKAAVINGKQVKGTASFTAAKESGTVEVTFEFNTSGLNGRSLVASEQLVSGEIVLASHDDINDVEQTVVIAGGGTTAKDSETLDHIAKADEQVTINDEIEYWGLEAGKEYSVEGMVVDKSASDPEKNPLASKQSKFTPESPDGVYTMTFTINASELKGKDAVVFETIKDGSDVVFTHKELEDESQTIHFPGGETTAKDSATNSHTATVARSVTITDEVTYRNLLKGKQYTVKGTLMDKATKEPLTIDGKQVTAEKAFTATEKDGSVTLEFTFNSTKLGGKSLVAYEKILLGDKEVFAHEDIDDADQTVSFPKVGTSLVDSKTGTRFAAANADVELVDTVSYSNVVIGEKYTVNGTLMDKATEQAVEINGKQIKATASFTAEKESGTVKVTFKFNTKGLDGKALVAYENLVCGGKVVASHNDINDGKQTVVIPNGKTTAKDSETLDHIAKADEQVTITDDVEYHGLEAGKEHEITGKVVDKAAADPEAKPLAVITEKFTPETSDGTYQMKFTFDASALKGKDTVVFETVTRDGVVVFEHKDLDDADQTVHFPGGGTTAKDKATNSHTARVAESVTITDEVTYTNLLEGKEYKVSGKLMDKATGKELLVDGKQVTAEKTFTADKADGSVTLEFTFNSTKLGGKSVVAYEKVLLGNTEVFAHEDLNDADQTVSFPKVGTKLRDKKTKQQIILPNGTVTLVDTVSYSNVVIGEKYTVNGKLMDKATNEALMVGGKAITGSAEFTAKKESGTVEVEFTFDAKGLDGKTLVAYEDLVCGGEVVANHNDINDADQTVYTPSGKTTATDSETGDHIAKADESVTINDKIEYHNLIPGNEYTVKGSVMDKSTGKAIVSGGKEVTVTEKFTPAEADGTYTMTFTFDGTGMKGKGAVVFETVQYEDIDVFVHADINDADQTVIFPDGGTTAKDAETDSHTARVSKSVTVKDEVAYTNLLAGKEYKVSGKLMDKATGKELLVGGKQVTAEKTFTADKADGSVILEFTFDSSALAGKSAVAFETITYNGKEVFVHADIDDADQTVNFPKVGTKLRDKATKQQIVLPDGTVTLVDTVSYENVTVGEKYTVNGTLTDKATGKALVVDGKAITGSAEFTAKKESGTVEVTFTFDAKDLDGKTLVAYEELICGGKVVAEHKAPGDKEQTVYLPGGKTTATDSETKDHIAKADKSVTINDEIEYHNLIPDKEYTIIGTVMDKSTGKAVVSGGKEVTVTEKFIPEKADGTYTMTFTFDGTGMKGKGAVVFETMQYEGIDVFVHADINDADQTVIFPDGGTTAKDAETDSHTARVAKSVTVRDEVVYRNLLAGKEYKVSGVLMDKAANKPLTVGGKQVTAEKTFTADKADGSVILEFTFDSSALAGKSAVAFETVTYNGKEVFVHADLNDKDQTVNFPKVGTFLKNADLDEQFAPADSDVELVDTVSYENVTVGDKYTVNGTLMNKATGEALERDGKPVTASAEFTAEKENGTIEVTFKFNTAGLNGAALVAFEDLVCNGKVVADHKDLKDAKQTVTVPDVTTDAAAEKTKEKTMLAHKDEVILDKVTYTGLIANKEYAVSGTVKVQEEGKDWGNAADVPSEIVSVNANGNGTAKIENGVVLYTPAGNSGEIVNGTITIGFKVDASDLAGEKLVVGETVEYNGKKIAVHTDLHDDDQTVYVPDGETAAVDTMTGIKNTLAADGRIFKDTFTYENLEIGKEYIFTGEVVAADRDENGETVKDENGNVLVRKIDSVMVHEDGTPVDDGCFRFTPETEDGQLELYFMVDATELANREVTVFEDVTRNGELVIVHHVLDGSQTVYVPEGATTAVDSETKDQVAMPDEDVSIIDTLIYKNLIPGKTYTVKGRVMRKNTVEEVPSELTAAVFKEGSEGTVEGVEESVVTFTPAARDGALELTFVFNASELKGEDVVVFERVYYNGTEVIIHENINDEAQTVHFPDGRTEAADPDTEDRTMKAGGEIIVRDRFFYENLIPGRQYAVTGKAMLKPMVEGGEIQEIPARMIDADGNEIESHIFTPEEKTGHVDVLFAINSDELAGRSAVMFEKMEYVNPELQIRTVIASHEDINDEDQTIHFPDGGTEALDSETKDHVSMADTEVTIYDEVRYLNLIPGKPYTVKGTLMDKATGEPVMVNGEELTVTDEFVPAKADGAHVIAFTFDGSLLGGHTTVAYETVYSNGKEVFVHADIEDEDQTVHFPDGRTTAADEKTKGHTSYAEKKATIYDEVFYENLIAGKQYTVKGVMMDKSTEKPLLINGKEVTAEKTFVAKEASGSVTLTFTFDASALAGKSIVAYETMYYDGKEVFTHADLTDRDQTIDFPSVKTEAKDKKDGDKTINPTGTVTLVDKVTYTNLEPGKKYVVTGMLMSKSTGNVARSGGKDITGQASFTAKDKDGTVEVEFKFNASDLKTGDYVVFEELYEVSAVTGGKVLVGDHKDINDKAQTVRRPEPPTPHRGARTGDTNMLFVWLGIAVAAMAAAAAVFAVRRRKTR